MKTLLSTCFILLSLLSIGQSNWESAPNTDSVLVFNRVEKIPLIEGCNDNSQSEETRTCFGQMVIRHISQNFVYPEEARKKGVQAKIYVQFVIEQDASISNVEVLKGATDAYKGKRKMKAQAKELDEAAIKVVSTLAIKEPAEQRGKPVRIRYVVPINAKLQ
ncbi:energy transducer TonB [Owenweeksia hongkongensis]|uniref:energy transducer TonB n=1 Tax=Owenweeksia hongkongensis TaxID=253245 RepID=UPI003A94E06A